MGYGWGDTRTRMGAGWWSTHLGERCRIVCPKEGRGRSFGPDVGALGGPRWHSAQVVFSLLVPTGRGARGTLIVPSAEGRKAGNVPDPRGCAP